MGLFEKAGRRFEQFKQKAVAAAEEEAKHECEACGTSVFTEREDCPECGENAVVRVETDESTTSSDTGDEQ